MNMMGKDVPYKKKERETSTSSFMTDEVHEAEQDCAETVMLGEEATGKVGAEC